MKEKLYPYRFKTKEEFEKEFGDSWRNGNSRSLINFIQSMDYLFGQPYPHDIEFDKYNDESELPIIPFIAHHYWRIRKFMLTKNKSSVPNYKPKKIERSL